MGIWKDRRIKTGYDMAENLAKCYNRSNWREHPDLQKAVTGESLDTLGWIDQPKINLETGKLFDGHLRVELALLKDGQAKIPVDYYELTQEEEDFALLVFDQTTTLATPNQDKLNELMKRTKGLVIDSPRLTSMFADLGVKISDNETNEDTPPQIDKAQELQKKWGVKIGDLWQLGEHRLICGDCTDRAVVNAVAFDDRIDFWYGDPPYSVGYADKNKSLNAVAFVNRIQTPIENDHLSTEDTAKNVWFPAFSNLFDIAKPGCTYYCSAPQGGDQMMMMMMLCKSGWLVKHELIWVKNNHVLGRADYQYKHEPIIYGWKPGASHYFIDSRSEMSVWEIDKPHNSDLHPTTKPLELVEKAVRNSSNPGGICADFFLGSGTTMVAAHRLGRRCFACEISPAYVAVCLQRMNDLGVKPELIDKIKV